MRVEIRSTHRYGFRSGTWAEIIDVEWVNNRPCYKVMFYEDHFVDWWPVHDEWDPYEFRQGADLRGQDFPIAGDGLSRWVKAEVGLVESGTSATEMSLFLDPEEVRYSDIRDLEEVEVRIPTTGQNS